MINIIYNKDVLVMPSRIVAPVAIPVDPFAMYGTPYGMFVPLSPTGNHFVRWVQKGMKDQLPKKSVLSYAVHVSNDGEVMLVTIDTEGGMILMTRVVSEQFAVLTGLRDTSAAYSDLISECKGIAQAVQILDEADPAGLFEPIIFFVEEWVQYAKEKGYTDNFYWTTFDEIHETFGK